MDPLSDPVFQLFPQSHRVRPLKGLYLSHDLRALAAQEAPLVYTDFVCSLDGRIALPAANTGVHQVPPAIANPRDWRLYQELAAQADVLITSGRYIQDLARGQAQALLGVSEAPEHADLHAWRADRGLPAQPAIAIISTSTDLPIPDFMLGGPQPLYLFTGASASAHDLRKLERRGVRVIRAGDGAMVDGQSMVRALADLGFNCIYSTAGPRVLATLLRSDSLQRLYLTTSLQVLGGIVFDTLFTGPEQHPPARFRLISLYYDPFMPEQTGQTFAVLEAV